MHAPIDITVVYNTYALMRNGLNIFPKNNNTI